MNNTLTSEPPAAPTMGIALAATCSARGQAVVYVEDEHATLGCNPGFQLLKVRSVFAPRFGAGSRSGIGRSRDPTAPGAATNHPEERSRYCHEIHAHWADLAGVGVRHAGGHSGRRG